MTTKIVAIILNSNLALCHRKTTRSPDTELNSEFRRVVRSNSKESISDKPNFRRFDIQLLKPSSTIVLYCSEKQLSKSQKSYLNCKRSSD